MLFLLNGKRKKNTDILMEMKKKNTFTHDEKETNILLEMRNADVSFIPFSFFQYEFKSNGSTRAHTHTAETRQNSK